MKAANHEYYEFVITHDGFELNQITFVLKNELNYIELIRFHDKEGWEIPPALEERANIAINRLLLNEAQNVSRLK